jgi:hypothetical protein
MTTVLSSNKGPGWWLIDQSVDQLLERYVAWREECLTVRLAYEAWTDADRGERQLAHAGYLAALDREQQAARVYAEQVDWVRRIQT